MLSASTGFKNALQSNIRQYDIKVTIARNDTGAQPLDISDRIASVNYTHDKESRAGRLTLEIDNYDYAYSPLNRDSGVNQKSGIYDPLLDANHVVRLYEGLQVNGIYEYVQKFEGYIGDDIDAGVDPSITISCRDKSKLLQDTYIYQGPSYSLYLVEEVIQDLIDEFLPSSGIKLVVLQATNYMIGRPDGPYAPKDTNLWDAVQLLADSASQELRFMEDGRLIMRKATKDLSTETPIANFDESIMIDDSMNISDADVRNHIVVKIQGMSPITKTDKESIARYGRRYMEVQRSMSDIITDVSQAHELASNILQELRFANPSESIETPLHPLIQVGDVVTVTNPKLGTSSATDIFEVVSVNGTYSSDRKRTTLNLKGYDLFINEESIAPKAPTALTVQMQSRKIQNYANSGWSGKEKTTYFPMLNWSFPIQDVSGNAIDKDFGGYIVTRDSYVNSKGVVGTTFTSATISSIPSYLPSLDKAINYFYDYTVATDIEKYVKAKPTTTKVTFRYKLTPINKRGKKGPVSNTYTVEVPVPLITK